jgi:prevent-host-death family protein
MEVGVRELRNRTREVVEAVRSGQRVVLTVHGEPVADIVPHAVRSRWRPGSEVGHELAAVQADPALTADLADLAGQTLEDLDKA